MSKKIPFVSQANVLDQYTHSKNPGSDPEIANLILETIEKNPNLYRHFFTSRPNPAWVPLLWDAGFFTKQPDLDVREEGTFLGYWYSHEYLCAVAGEVPDYFIKHINLNLDKSNDWYKATAILSLMQLAPNLVSTIIPKILGWLDGTAGYAMGSEASELLLFMAENGYEDDAFNLFSLLTTPILKPERREKAIASAFDSITLIDSSPIDEYKADNKFISKLKQFDIKRLLKSLDGSLREGCSM